MKNLLRLFACLLLLFTISCGDDDDDSNIPDENMDDPIESTDAELILKTHNEYRTAVGIDDIKWSEELAESAQAWADQLAVNCDFEHSDSGFGENIWRGTEGFFTLEDAVNSWGEEEEFYDVDSNECVGGDCLHYTQIVWENTTEVGCGTAVCNGFLVLVCQYNPAGNIIGQRPY